MKFIIRIFKQIGFKIDIKTIVKEGDFLDVSPRALVTRLLSQGYKVNRLSNTFKKFYGRHTDLVGQYKKNVCQMFADSIS